MRLLFPSGKAARGKLAVVLGMALQFGTAAFTGQSFGFHDGGTAPCEGCHTMHNVRDGAPANPNAYLLQGVSPSSLCLNCHQGQFPANDLISTSDVFLATSLPPSMVTPGGDFAWIKKTYSWVSGMNVKREEGDRHGHNIVALDFGYRPDASNAVAPRGTYPAQSLHCSSCHDPHGKYRVLPDGTVATSGLPIASSGSLGVNGIVKNPVAGQSAVGVYRMLGGAGYQPPFAPGQAFTASPPAAVAPSPYNRVETATQTRVAYGSNVSEWCGNCHTPGGALFHHGNMSATLPLGQVYADQYNRYLKTGDLSGTQSTSFSSLVPFQMGLTNAIQDRNGMAAAACSDGSCLSGPGAGATVSCLTCHRAHASGWRAIMRWNPDAALLVYGGLYPGVNNGAPADYHMGRTEAETSRAYYDRPASVFGFNQNQLCEKCHAGGAP